MHTLSSAGAIAANWVDGVLWGCAPSYKVEFARSGPVFSAVFGQRATRTARLGLRLLGLRVGARELGLPAAERTPALLGTRVTYRVGPGIDEHYDLRLRGLEQSFVFAERPAGAGELVVRLGVSTDLELAEASASGLRFALSPELGIRYGVAWAIDAAGRKTEVAVEASAGEIRLVVPAAVVAGARYPLVIDPLIGSDASVSGAADQAFRPAIATDGAHVLVAWESVLSAVDVDIRAALFDAAGGPATPSVVVVEASTASDSAPAVAWCEASQAFVIVGERRTAPGAAVDLHARKLEVAADQLVVSSGGQLTGLPTQPLDPGDELRPRLAQLASGSQLLLAYAKSNAAQGGLRAALLDVPLNGRPSLAGSGAAIVSTDPLDREPALSSQGGARHVLAWQRFDAGDARDHVHAKLLTAAAGVLSFPASTFAAGAGFDDDHPAVDGDGSDFVLAHEREAFAGSGDNQLRVLRLRSDASAAGGLALVSTGAELGQLGVEDAEPAVAATDRTVLLAWSAAQAGSSLLKLQAVDPLACLACETEHAIAPVPVPLTDGRPALLGFGLGSTSATDQAVWIAHELGFADGSRAIDAQRYEPADRSALALQDTDCGSGFELHVTHCLSGATPSIGWRVQPPAPLSSPGTATFVLIAAATDPIVCSSSTDCLLVPDLVHAFVLSGGNLDANGRAGQRIALVNPELLSDLTYFAQWVVIQPAANCLGVQTSSGGAIQTALDAN